MFDPKAHLIQLPRRVKDKATGQYVTVHDDYLEVRWRVLMFREKYPHGVITTEEIFVDLDRGYARYKATAEDGDGGRATGYGTETKADFTDYAERAETRAIGRALALLGFGTQFVGADLTEGEHVADAPVSPPASPLPLPVGEESHPAPPAETGPTKDQVDHLTKLGLSAMGSRESFARSIRITMALPGDVAITKKLLRTMTVTQFQEAEENFRDALRMQVEQDVPDHPPPSGGASSTSAGDEPTHEPQDAKDGTQEPRGEAITAAVEGLAVPDADAEAKAKLRSMALGWGLPEHEVDHVLTHHKDLTKARDLLWKARRPWAKTPIESAAAAD
jgi:hypothetical protein